MIEIIKTKNEWDTFLDKVDCFDFYHTYDYHKLSLQPEEECILITYSDGNKLIGSPFISRPIPNSNYRDLTSVYGYAGPVSKNIDDSFDTEKFSKALNECLRDQNMVAVFSRLNPYISFQHNILRDIGQIDHVGKIVNIDLTAPLDIQRQKYQRRIKGQINKARRLCTIKKAETKEEVLKFIEIYYENMDRVEARSSYYFDNAYFFNFIESESLNLDILLATLNETNEIIAGVMFVKTNNIVQYHLSGSKEAYLDLAPVKLLIDEMRIQATNEGGYDHFNLGGGYGSQNDSLLRFKLSFSKQMNDFCVWKHIVDQDVYDELASSKASKHQDYFPQYRNPN